MFDSITPDWLDKPLSPRDPLDSMADTVCAAMAPPVPPSVQAAAPARPTLPRGIILQVYLGAIPGETHAARIAVLSTGLDRIKAAGCVGVAFHGAPEAVAEHWPEYAALAAAHGLLAFATYGLPGGLSPVEAGTLMGRIAARADCAGTGFDAEGFYDHGKHADAVAMVKAFRAVAPFALLFDQPWFACESHADFPYEEFAGLTPLAQGQMHPTVIEGVDVRCEQRYVNDFKKQWGLNRFSKVFLWTERDWRKLEQAKLAPLGLVRPHAPTIEADGWDDIPGARSQCLDLYPTLVVWCDHGLPPQSFLDAVAARHPREVAPTGDELADIFAGVGSSAEL